MDFRGLLLKGGRGRGGVEERRGGREWEGREREGIECRLGVPVHCLQSNGVIIHMMSHTSATRFDFCGRDVKNTNSRY